MVNGIRDQEIGSEVLVYLPCEIRETIAKHLGPKDIKGLECVKVTNQSIYEKIMQFILKCADNDVGFGR